MIKAFPLSRFAGCVALAITLGVPSALLAAEPGPPVEITIRALREQMKFDTKEFKVPVGGRVRLHFKNEDGLPHNVLICLPRELCEPGANEDNGLEVAQAAWNLGSEGPEKQWIPKHPRVFIATRMLDGDQEQILEFDAPTRAGRYPFVCTFPGHAMLMFGLMHVQAEVAGLRHLEYKIFRTGALTAFPNFSTLRDKVIGEGALADGLIDATPVAIADHYAMEFKAVLTIPQDGDYTFSLAADKGTQLFIDDVLKIDHRTGHSVRAIKSEKISLKAGERRITMHYWHQLGDDPEASLVWSGPGFDERSLARIDLVERKRQNDGDRLEGMQLRPTATEPVFYRNYLADLPKGGFAIGFPGGANFSWDPENHNVSSLWAGDFLDVKAHRVSRGAGAIKPAGFDVVRLVHEPPFFFSADPKKQTSARFLGYRLDTKRSPIFRYEIDGVAVEESFRASGDVSQDNLTLTRTLVLHATAGVPADWWLRLATHPKLVAAANGAILDDKIRVTLTGATSELRDTERARELVARVPFENGQTTLTLEYRWLATATKAAAAHAH
ncbi:PA14 domain-containing protein [Oleiharenicola lentus]|uniref:PA14 domain-containing protein n=1 Tax=Oleiharenicola lentus TaxID=2508720 RepID=UPI003F660CB7